MIWRVCEESNVFLSNSHRIGPVLLLHFYIIREDPLLNVYTQQIFLLPTFVICRNVFLHTQISVLREREMFAKNERKQYFFLLFRFNGSRPNL